MKITELIQHPERLDKKTLYDLRNILALYPYYQPARLLMLQNLFLLHDPTFDEELRRAAIYITDRRKLFDLVEAAHYQLKSAATEQPNAPAPTVQPATGTDRTVSLIDDFLSTIPQDEPQPKEEKKQRKPNAADAAIDYVAYMLQQEANAEKQTVPEMRGQSLIDDFINNDGGKLQLQDEPEFEPEPEPIEATAEDNPDDGYFTETLAKIYIKQKRYSKAIEIIQRLNLNYPKKSAYFADQIRFLRKLMLNEDKNK
jgi:hypothetical protein